MPNNNEIRAVFDAETITVYQAYCKEIAQAAVQAQTFVPPFKMGRMTWIKPSFLWAMYRSGWATKPKQEHILAIKIKREGFDWAVQNGVASTFEASGFENSDEWKQQLQKSVVRIQWDPERSIRGDKLDYRSIQIGLRSKAVEKYVNEWITEITDITVLCKAIHSLIQQRKIEEAMKLLPKETVYIIDNKLQFKQI
jgi:hypothetical protein